MDRLYVNIKKLREGKGWTQEKLGFELGKKRDAIYRMEKGEVEISHKDLIKLSSIFEISLDKLVYDEELDASSFFDETKAMFGEYNIKKLHPCIESDFEDLPDNFIELMKAISLEVFGEFLGKKPHQVKAELINKFLKRLDNLNDKQVSIDEVKKMLLDWA